MSSLDQVLAAVAEELSRAVIKFKPFNTPHEGYAVIKEELDELWEEVKADNVGDSIGEAVQVAAMAVRYIIDIGEKYGS